MISGIPAAVRNAFINGTAEQDFILVRRDYANGTIGWFSAVDGDFTSDGVTINQNACENENLTFGGVMIDTISFSLINSPIDGTSERILGNFNWGDMQAYVGVKIATAPLGDSDRNCSIRLGTSTYYGMNDGFYRYYNGTHTKIISTSQPVISIMYEDPWGQIYVSCGTAFYKYDVGSQSYTEITPYSWHLIRKMEPGLGFVMRLPTTATEPHLTVTRRNENTHEETVFQYVTLGTYIIDKPKSLQNPVVEINGAFNVLHKFDKDASSALARAFINYDPMILNSDQITLLQLLNSLLYDTGITYDGKCPANTEGWTQIVKKSDLDGSYTIRILIGYIAERIGCTAVLRYRDVLSTAPDLVFIRAAQNKSNYVETITLGRIVSDSLDISSVDTPYIDTLVLHKIDGSIQRIGIASMSGTSGDYEISGNPFIDTPLSTDLITALSSAGFQYRPMAFTVINADPCIEVCDPVRVQYYTNATVPVIDDYGNPTSTTKTLTPLVMPLMRRVLKWQGTLMADYEASGEGERYAERTGNVYKESPVRQYTNIKVNDLKGYTDGKIGNLIKSVTIPAADYTIRSDGWAAVSKPTEVRGKTIISAEVYSWTSTTGAFSLTGYNSNSHYAYIIGEPGAVITGLAIQLFYID